MLGLISEKRKITAIDYDSRKIDIAGNIPVPGNNVEFHTHAVLSYDLKQADVFILSDMLHYMPEDDQKKIIERCIMKLNKNGMVIIRDANKDMEKRHLFTKMSEIISTFIKFNKTKYNHMFFISKDMITKIAEKHSFALEVHDNSAITSNLTFILKKKKKNRAAK